MFGLLSGDKNFDASKFKKDDYHYDDAVEYHVNAGLCDKNCDMDPLICGFAIKLQKGFLLSKGENYLIVHPDDYDKVERIVNCTLDPIYELIHELRYHPVIGIDANIARKRQKLSGCSADHGTVKCAEPSCHLLLCTECSEMGRIHCEDHRGHGG